MVYSDTVQVSIEGKIYNARVLGFYELIQFIKNRKLKQIIENSKMVTEGMSMAEKHAFLSKMVNQYSVKTVDIEKELDESPEMILEIIDFAIEEDVLEQLKHISVNRFKEYGEVFKQVAGLNVESNDEADETDGGQEKNLINSQ